MIRRLRRTAWAVLLALLVPTAGAAPVARADPPELDRPTAVLTLTGLEPRAPSASDEIVVRGEVRNAGNTRIRSA